MTVRDKAGRRRFILFETAEETDAGMGRIISLFNGRFRELGIDRREIRFRVVFVGDGVGIVRCSHVFKDVVLNMINWTELNGVKLKTLRTSGTLKTLKVWLRDHRSITVPGKTRFRKGQKPPGNPPAIDHRRTHH